MPRNRTRRRTDSNDNTSTSTAAHRGSNAPPRSKDGCWTCRIRRKRCDELPNESGFCQACVRLGIECLGWGSRRPDWCRDKQLLADYKLGLKKKLCSRAGTRPSAGSASAAVRKHNSLEEAINAASASSTSAHAPLHDREMARAPSGESPSTAADSDDEEHDEDVYEPSDAFNRHPLDEQPSLDLFIHSGLDTDFDLDWQDSVAYEDPTFVPVSTPTLISPSSITATQAASSAIPQFTHTIVPPQSNSQRAHHRSTHQRHLSHHRRQVAPITKLAPHLHNILSTSTSLPTEYRQIILEILNLYSFKATAHCSAASATVEQEVARRAQSIEDMLNRLNRRSSFDVSFANLSGLDFDPSSLYLASTGMSSSSMDLLNTPASTTSIMSGASFNSPMTMWSPDLVPDSLSTFSSSVPTSPAASVLAMSGSNNQTALFGEFFAYDHSAFNSYPSIHALSSLDAFHTSSQVSQLHQQQQQHMEMQMGALGLGFSNDLIMNEFPNPAFQVFPSTSASAPSAQPMSFSTPFEMYSKPIPARNASISSPIHPSNSPATTTADSDPYGIHYETCALLLRVVLASPPPEVEDILESLTTKFAPLAATISSSPTSSPMTPNRVFSPLLSSDAYLFSATIAGALSASTERRSFFMGIVRSIEERTLAVGKPMGHHVDGGRCGLILNEIWAA